jgi:hypothetical protein
MGEDMGDCYDFTIYELRFTLDGFGEGGKSRPGRLVFSGISLAGMHTEYTHEAT